MFGPQVGIAEHLGARGHAQPGHRRPVGARPGNPSAVVLAKAQPQPSDCMLTSLRWVCSTLLGTATEEQYGFDQAFTEPSAGQATLRGSAVLTDSPLIDRYARFDQQEATATASSVFTSAPQDQPRSAFDGDPATTWIASSADRSPTLTIRWGYPRTVSRVTIARPPGASGPASCSSSDPAARPAAATLGAGGVVTFTPMRTTSLRFTFTPVQAPLEVSDVTDPRRAGHHHPVRAVPAAVRPGTAAQGQRDHGADQGVRHVRRPAGRRPMRFTACSRSP